MSAAARALNALTHALKTIATRTPLARNKDRNRYDTILLSLTAVLPITPRISFQGIYSTPVMSTNGLFSQERSKPLLIYETASFEFPIQFTALRGVKA